MEFIIGTQFSREFSFEVSLIVDRIKNLLNNELGDNIYHANALKVYIDFICVSKGFEPFFMARPLKVHKSEPAISYELKLDFDEFFNANEQQRLEILKREFISQSKEILDTKKLKDFNLSQFISDVEKCFE